MYLFSFHKFAGADRIFHTDANIWKAGDLLQTEGDIFLNLWPEVSFPELYYHKYPATPSTVLYPWFFDQRFLSFLHWMTYQRYASYKSVVKYFVSMEIQQLLLRESKTGKKREIATNPPKSPLPPFTKGGSTDKTNNPSRPAGQHLIIFPDNRSRFNMLPDALLQSPEIINLISTDTQNRKDLNRRRIKKEPQGIITATQSEVFQPYANLQKILFIDPHKRYYHNQQDPRYTLSTVVQKMGEIYDAEIQMVSFQGTLTL